MKYSKYFLIIILMFFSATSCKKNFLDVSDGSLITREHYVTNLATMREYLNGTYLRFWRGVYYLNNVIYPDLIADNIKPSKTPSLSLNAQYLWEQQTNEAKGSTSFFGIMDKELNSNSLSYVGYLVIRSCSFIIEKTQEFRDEDPAKADIIIGEAYGIRALTHFWLVNFFAQAYNFTADGSHPGIAYITSPDQTKPVSRQTVAEVYSNIIDDLKNAEKLLPAGSTNTMAMTSNAAKALLARVYLFKDDFTNAKNFAREISTAIPIMTTNYPGGLFASANLPQTEAIYQIAPDKTYTDFSAQYYDPSYFLVFLASSDLAASLTENPTDKRSVWIKDTVISGQSNKLIRKFPKGVVSGISPVSESYYQPVVRSSEMYLTAAEAYARLNSEDSARFYVNAIRSRANIPTLSTSVSGPALLDSIYKERRRELCFESLRMFDLLRWKKGVVRTDAPTPNSIALPYPSNKAISPIPGLDVNIAGIPQNPGY